MKILDEAKLHLKSKLKFYVIDIDIIVAIINAKKIF